MGAWLHVLCEGPLCLFGIVTIFVCLACLLLGAGVCMVARVVCGALRLFGIVNMPVCLACLLLGAGVCMVACVV